MRWRHLLRALLGGAVAGWALMRIMLAVGLSVPHLPWLGVGVMLLIAALLAGLGWEIRRYLRGKHQRRPTPSRATGTLAAGQAGALTGALMTGWYAAGALVALTLPDVPSTQDAALRHGVHAVAAAVLALAGMLAQWCCQIQPDDGESGGGRTGPEAAAT